VDILKKFCELEAFEHFCLRNREYCPAEKENKGNDRTPVCHWCQVSFSHAISTFKDEIVKRLE
jgi:hypothetical protein